MLHGTVVQTGAMAARTVHRDLDRTATIADGLLSFFFFIFCIYACSHGRDCERTRRFSSPGGGPPPCKLSGPRVANRSTPPGEIRGPAGQPDGARHSFSMHGRAWKLELGIPATGRSFWKIFVHGDPSERAPRRHGAPFVIPPLRGTVRRPDCFIPHAE